MNDQKLRDARKLVRTVYLLQLFISHFQIFEFHDTIVKKVNNNSA